MSPLKHSGFRDGFRSELANREFARRAMAILAERTAGLESAAFWRGYHELEELNAPRFAAAARRLNAAPSRPRAALARGWVTGHTPAAVLPELLRFAYPRTVEYAADLRRLRDIGPLSEREFLDYMVRQEDLQVRMMHSALLGEYEAITAMVQEFIAAET